jgi:two-component system cell cycle response regulator DivK
MRVLIFDDDPDILQICSIVLRSRGIATDLETNCERIIEKISSSSPDVILMDNKIPPSGGIDASLLVKSSVHKNIPLIFFSANHDVQSLAADAHADYYIEKPFDLDELVELVMKAGKERSKAM